MTATQVQGVDLSHYQSVDWGQVPQLAFVAHKASQGVGGHDPNFAHAWAEMRRRGFRYRAAYHFLDSTPGHAQADHFMSIVGSIGAGEALVLDWEMTGTTMANAAEFVDHVERQTGRTPILYAGQPGAGKFLSGGHTALDRCPIWLPTYGPSYHCRLPVMLWQFSSSGKVAGISGRCDVNNVIDWHAMDRAFNATPAPQPQPQPIPTPTPQPTPVHALETMPMTFVALLDDGPSQGAQLLIDTSSRTLVNLDGSTVADSIRAACSHTDLVGISDKQLGMFRAAGFTGA